MKTHVFLLAGMLVAGIAFGQNKEENEVEVKAPAYKSKIDNSIYDFLNRSIEYPVELKSWGMEGTEVVQFTVNQEGNIMDFNVINSVSHEIDAYVIETLKMTDGKWNPGTAYEIPQTMNKEVSIVFSSRTENEMVKSAKKFEEKGNECLFEKNNPEKALKYYDRGIVLLPNEESLLAARSLCNIRMGNITDAERDWQRIKILAERQENIPNLEIFAAQEDIPEGFKEMIQAMNK